MRCECVVFAAAPAACIARCQQRPRHETVAPREAARVVSTMARQFRPPAPAGHGGAGGERFQRLERVTSFRMADTLVERYLGRG